MKKRKCKLLKKNVARVLDLIMLITCIAMPVFGGTTESKSGLRVTLEIDKESYSAGEEVIKTYERKL